MRHLTRKNKPHNTRGDLRSLSAIDIEACANLGELLDSLSMAGFGARELGRGWSVLKRIAADRECDLVLTVSGAMTIAKLGHIFGALISRGIIKAVITTGAVVTHGFVEEMGLKHYQVPRGVSDSDLLRLRLNRIYDSLEPEANLNLLEESTIKAFSLLPPSVGLGSVEIVRYLSEKLLKNRIQEGFLGSALNKEIDIYVPALTDSELGLYLFRYLQSKQKHQPAVLYDPMKDLSRYASWIESRKRIAFLTLGGGVPRNWAQQMLPFLKSFQRRGKQRRLPRVAAGIRICPDQASLGHLSGSTYSEGITWAKFDDRDKDNFVEINADATIVFPFLAKALTEHLDSV